MEPRLLSAVRGWRLVAFASRLRRRRRAALAFAAVVARCGRTQFGSAAMAVRGPLAGRGVYLADVVAGRGGFERLVIDARLGNPRSDFARGRIAACARRPRRRV